MLLSTITTLLASVASAASVCTPEMRLAGARGIPDSYNLVAPGASAAGFAKVPFAKNCQTSIAANGAPPIPVAIDRTTTLAFADSTRQVFSEVTGQYKDFPANGTTDIITNVTLGAAHSIELPVTFFANVYLDYTKACEIKAVRAFATVPSKVLGQLINAPGVPSGILRS